MKLYIEVVLDRQSDKRRGRVIGNWFSVMSDLVFESREDCGRTLWSAGILRDEWGGSTVNFHDVPEERSSFLSSLLTAPVWAEASLNTCDDQEQLARIRTFPSLFGDNGNLSLSAIVPCSDEDVSDEEFCSRVASALAAAVGDLNPSFGRIECGIAYDRSNLDIGLRRRLKISLRESRQVLRGYAWVTIVPGDVVERLGGASGLGATGAFSRVYPLLSGGALLQASASVNGFTDEVMERVFLALSPVLPPGLPTVHVAFPEVRFVSRDAAAGSESP